MAVVVKSGIEKELDITHGTVDIPDGVLRGEKDASLVDL